MCVFSATKRKARGYRSFRIPEIHLLHQVKYEYSLPATLSLQIAKDHLMLKERKKRRMNEKLPESTKIAISNIISHKSGCNKILACLYICFSKYIIVESSRTSNANIKIFINFDYLTREDHLKLLKEIRDRLDLDYDAKTDFFHVKRSLSFDVFAGFMNLIRCANLFNIFARQMRDITNKIYSDKYEKVLVFCDSVPLQNYLCSIYNSKNVATYTLQHGFYVDDENSVFRGVYQSSNALNFFVWDKRTLKYLEKFGVGKKRRYIECGPIFGSANIRSDNKEERIREIAIYGCGKDQVEQNKYLFLILKHMQRRYDLNVEFVSHPRFNFFDRVIWSCKNRIKLHPNMRKKKDYDLHLVLNSSVWLELSARDCKFYILNRSFEQKEDAAKVADLIVSGNYASDNVSIEPFHYGEIAMRIVCNFLSNRNCSDVD